MERLLKIRMKNPEKIRIIAILGLLHFGNVDIKQFLLLAVILFFYPQEIKLEDKDPLEAERIGFAYVLGTMFWIYILWIIILGKELEQITTVMEGVWAVALFILLFLIHLTIYEREKSIDTLVLPIEKTME